MLPREWNDKLNRTIVARARQDKVDLEDALIDELTSYLEGKSSLFGEVATAGRVSLHDLGYSETLHATPPRQQPQRLRDVLQQAEALELSVFDLLQASVEAGDLEMRDALHISFQLGKRISRMAEQIDQHERSDHDLTRTEQQAVRQEILTRQYRQSEQRAEPPPAPRQPTPAHPPQAGRYAPQLASPATGDQ